MSVEGAPWASTRSSSGGGQQFCLQGIEWGYDTTIVWQVAGTSVDAVLE